MSSRPRAVLAARLLLAAFVTVTASAAPRQQPAAPPARPKLLVLIVVDQFRADYVEWYGRQWTAGLARLFEHGAVFPRAAMPYAITKTCAGHASISTGTSPATHGLIDNEWFDRARGAIVSCTSDPQVQSVALDGGIGSERHSAVWLRATTIGDALRAESGNRSRVLSIALKARSAIALGGHPGPGATVLWEEDSGRWATSSAFTAKPWPEVAEYVTAHPVTGRGESWHRLLDPSAYVNDDRAPGEPSGGAFPHPLVVPPGVPFAAVWDMSPWSDAYVGEMAGALAGKLALGQRESTDLLAIGFSALDYVGHSYGPRSHEVQDVLVRLDQVIGRLLVQLDRSVGAGNYVVALSSDHGVALLPEQARTVAGVAGGRVNPTAVGLAVEAALSLDLGQRRFVEGVTSTYVHFLPGMLEKIQASPAAVKAATDAALSVSGIERVFWSEELAGTRATTDRVLAGMRRSYVTGRSGDLAFLPQPNWVVASGGTHHGSMHAYDTEVPIVFFGGRITAGRHERGSGTVSPLDIAPTLAALAGITMPGAEGRVRLEVVAP